jgi:hypothetical protein
VPARACHRRAAAGCQLSRQPDRRPARPRSRALADALRLDGRLPAARKSLERAWQAIELGTGDPLEQAGLLLLEGNLQLTLGEGAAAAALLRPAAAI